ncbi:hypothetical protein PR202_ga15931 [Eleusine coracana subsp. coracana]|uniref:Uncharacterized protein n=1 Tax=Eleusine coracana subsp. coracana TaxID=191504 RepID=A0AAV5CKP7_ELECO|nr:hypothetical protein PR202_ga15931 [Eleusine coracana subsp. coracana]
MLCLPPGCACGRDAPAWLRLRLLVSYPRSCCLALLAREREPGNGRSTSGRDAALLHLRASLATVASAPLLQPRANLSLLSRALALLRQPASPLLLAPSPEERSRREKRWDGDR